METSLWRPFEVNRIAILAFKWGPGRNPQSALAYYFRLWYIAFYSFDRLEIMLSFPQHFMLPNVVKGLVTISVIIIIAAFPSQAGPALRHRACRLTQRSMTNLASPWPGNCIFCSFPTQPKQQIGANHRVANDHSQTVICQVCLTHCFRVYQLAELSGLNRSEVHLHPYWDSGQVHASLNSLSTLRLYDVGGVFCHECILD
ncbi:unnamed protein product [Protopolystoma xenopodis]|uniref:Uncharacterized protein n=1 Tax=Protopolystoma xenopodis TaxID=117903 RepID=A0A3S5APQ4_9PLAT|nr:unnamed protein product [Protopolystoma xenopodis]